MTAAITAPETESDPSANYDHTICEGHEMKKAKQIRVAAFAAIMLGVIGFADPVFADYLVNAGFEDPDLPNGAMSLTIPGWEQDGDGSGNVLNVPAGKSRLPKPIEGYNVGIMYLYNQTDFAEHFIYQTPVASMAPDTEYLLSFSIGNPKGKIYLGKWSSSALSVHVYFVAGTDPDISNAVGEMLSIPLSDIGLGTFRQYAVSFDTAVFDGPLDQPLSVVFRIENNGMPVGLAGCFIDNVQMIATQE